MTTIDFVILWVDGNDPDWQRDFRQARRTENEDASEIRYRDWRNLHYWFRGVERFAPWVRKIHFITWGHLPAWLRVLHPKLHIVNHADFIPSEYLPTFNSNAIELNIHRIEGLAEHFVLFNDDTFLCRPTAPEEFFRNGLPCDMARLSIVQPSSVAHIVYNDLELINREHVKKEAIRRHPGKWFSPRYGIGNLLKTTLLLPWSTFPGILDTHMPQPYRRELFIQAWERWGGALDATSCHRTRNLADVSHWLIRYDMLVRGDFAPRAMGDCRLMTIADDTLPTICSDIRNRRYRMVCLNDSERISDFEQQSRCLCDAFEHILPGKSGFENESIRTDGTTHIGRHSAL